MTPEEFEDHCWKDVISADDLRIYRRYLRDISIGKRPALLAIDLYKAAYSGGAKRVLELQVEHPGSCGEFAWNAIAPTTRLFTAARKARLPIVYTSGAPLHAKKLKGSFVQSVLTGEDPYGIFEPFEPQADDRIIYKERASAFYGTPISAYLLQQGCDSVIVCGESTSGCVRASVVDAYSAGFHVTIAEECCFDRSLLIHKINLFDLHHKYADVMHIDDIAARLEGLAGPR